MMSGVGIKSDSFNVSAPGADTNILTTSLTPTYGGWFQIFVVLGTSSIFNMTETRGATTFTIGLNNSVALDSGDGCSFTVPVLTTSSYNFQVETNGIIRILKVLEVNNAVGGNSQGFQA